MTWQITGPKLAAPPLRPVGVASVATSTDASLRSADPSLRSGSSASRNDADDARLKKSAQQMEGLFVQQLYKAMRETVPQGEGVVDGGSGEEMFTGLMDEHLAADTPTQWAHGLAAAAYRQLRAALPHAAAPAAESLAAPAMPLSSPPQSLPLASPPPLKLDASR